MTDEANTLNEFELAVEVVVAISGMADAAAAQFVKQFRADLRSRVAELGKRAVGQALAAAELAGVTPPPLRPLRDFPLTESVRLELVAELNAFAEAGKKPAPEAE